MPLFLGTRDVSTPSTPLFGGAAATPNQAPSAACRGDVIPASMDDLKTMLDLITKITDRVDAPWTKSQDYKEWLGVTSGSREGIAKRLINEGNGEAVKTFFDRELPCAYWTGDYWTWPLYAMITKKLYAEVVYFTTKYAESIKTNQWLTNIILIGVVEGGFTAAQLTEIHAATPLKLTQELFNSTCVTGSKDLIEAIFTMSGGAIKITYDNFTRALCRGEDKTVEWMLDSSDFKVTGNLVSVYFSILTFPGDANKAGVKNAIRCVIEKGRYHPPTDSLHVLDPEQRIAFEEIFKYKFPPATTPADTETPTDPADPADKKDSCGCWGCQEQPPATAAPECFVQ